MTKTWILLVCVGVQLCCIGAPSPPVTANEEPSSSEENLSADEIQSFYTLSDFEDYAAENMDANHYTYFSGGSFQKLTVSENTVAFARYRILPHHLHDTTKVDLTTHVLGHKVSVPVGIAGTYLGFLSNPNYNHFTAKVAQEKQTVVVVSTWEKQSLEEIAAVCKNAIRFLEVTSIKSKFIFDDLLVRAKKAGFHGLVLAVGNAVESLRPDLEKANFDPFLTFDPAKHGSFRKYSDLPNLKKEIERTPSLTYLDLAHIKKHSGLPLIVKGVQTPLDAQLAIAHGADAIIVSNGGGLQLDSAPASIFSLRKVVKEVSGRCEVYFDGGVRTGPDAFKALAMGAKLVFTARPFVYGAFTAGEAGVKKVFDILTDELEVTMKLAGAKSLKIAGPSFVKKQKFYYPLTKP